jgi:hypothetical protein
MAKKKRETERATGDLTVSLTLRDFNSGNPLTDSLPGRLDNISVAGASLSVNHIRTGGYHLFYAAKETQEPMLYLESKHSENPDDFFSIPVRPVWFNCEGVEAETTFKIGVEFMQNADNEKVRKLLKKACGSYNPSSNWLKIFFLRYLCPLFKGFFRLFVWHRKDGKKST